MIRLILLLLCSSIAISTTVFQQCNAGYFFDLQHCEVCQSNCDCSAMNGCDSCVAGYTMYNGACIQCPQSSGIYGTCSSCCSKTSGTQLSCTDCAVVAGSFTFLYSGRCIVSPGCFEIDSKGFCTECFSGYYEKDNLCYTCDTSCATCTDSTNCLTCASGYYWGVSSGGLCTACPSGCSSCASDGTCSACLANYYLFGSHCLSCPSNCDACTDGSTCTSCSSGILVSNLCILCTDTTYGGSTGCQSCEANNNFIVCTQCQDTYFLDTNGACQTCSSFITGGLRCRDQNTPTQCQNDADAVLTNRYYLVGITCIANTKSCRKISDIDGNCSQCYDGYTLNNGTCTVCPFTGCTAANTSVVAQVCTCAACDPGYYLTAPDCTACSAGNCAVCPGDVCSQCNTGYYLNLGACVMNVMANCMTQASASACSVCDNGYYKGSDNMCYACQSNCMTCTDRFTCTSCSASHYLHSSNTCVANPSNCVQNTNGVCSVCSYGYYLSNGLCLPCQIQLGTLEQCEGLCPIDYYIQSLVLSNSASWLYVSIMGLLLWMMAL